MTELEKVRGSLEKVRGSLENVMGNEGTIGPEELERICRGAQAEKCLALFKNLFVTLNDDQRKMLLDYEEEIAIKEGMLIDCVISLTAKNTASIIY